MRSQLAKPEHEVVYQDLCALVNKHAASISAMEILAIASNMVGKLVAMQDQRTVSPSMAMEVFAKNIEAGNRQILDSIMKSRGSS
jgi:tRNA threonylcarbamoyladenosine modification (KEOPS) complex Cgi121 subunit